jgi:hypothetical protein
LQTAGKSTKGGGYVPCDAILSEEDYPRLGKSLAKNHQQLLRNVVLDYIARHPALFDVLPPTTKASPKFEEVLVDAPKMSMTNKKGAGQQQSVAKQADSTKTENWRTAAKDG